MTSVCVRSREKTAHLFAQLSSELLQEGVGVERLYLLLQELRTAAHRNVALSRLFWKVSIDVCVAVIDSLSSSTWMHWCEDALRCCVFPSPGMFVSSWFRLWRNLCMAVRAQVASAQQISSCKLQAPCVCVCTWVCVSCLFVCKLLVIFHNKLFGHLRTNSFFFCPNVKRLSSWAIGPE